MASAMSLKAQFASRATIMARPRRAGRLDVKAFTTDSGKLSLEEINSQIGRNIKQAAARVGAMRAWQANAAIGKYVRQAAEDAAAGRLKPKTPSSKK